MNERIQVRHAMDVDEGHIASARHADCRGTVLASSRFAGKLPSTACVLVLICHRLAMHLPCWERKG